MSPVLLTLLSALIKGTDLESGIMSILKMGAGAALNAADHQALGAAMEVAHKRVMALATPAPAPPPPGPASA